MLKTTSSERSFNPVQDFITQETWDGQPRIATTLIDYLGAEDNPLVREQTKLWFVAAVARVFCPGCKFDNVLTLPGPQGIGKSTFLMPSVENGSTIHFPSPVVIRRKWKPSLMAGLSKSVN